VQDTLTSLLFDFSDPQSVALWNPINDGVMGGVSTSQLCYDSMGHAVFAGHVSFENNGGFASVRCQPGDLGRAGINAYVLDVHGDGKHYKFNLRTDNSFDGINYQARFDPPSGIWTTCRLASADFLPTWRGKSVPDAPPLDSARVRQVGLMIADRQEGPFRLALRSIAVEAP
jgi:NADH dehydrogenase [ubiquinone] 1 alpha subcomplex assembly factor 1